MIVISVPHHSPVISIITPTYNRAEELVHLLKSIQGQSLDPHLFEMIIADDGSSDSTPELITEWQEKVNFTLKYFTQKNQGPGAARNLGMAESIGDLFVFIDSDCEAHPDWLNIIYDAYQKDTFDACGGPDGAKDDFTLLQKAIDFAMTSFFTTGGMRGHSEKMLAKFYPRTHNMAVKKSIYESVGGFGNLRHGQDIEFSNRIRKSGARIQFLIDAVVYHRRRTSLRQFFKQVFNWGVARVNLAKIDGSMLEAIHFLPALATLLGLAAVSTAFLSGISIEYIFACIFIPFALLSLFGAKQKKDFRIFFYLLIVIPAQILGYGLGFILNFIKRYIFGLDAWRGFTKRYYQ